jgi:hypothetical protein
LLDADREIRVRRAQYGVQIADKKAAGLCQGPAHESARVV